MKIRGRATTTGMACLGGEMLRTRANDLLLKGEPQTRRVEFYRVPGSEKDEMVSIVELFILKLAPFSEKTWLTIALLFPQEASTWTTVATSVIKFGFPYLAALIATAQRNALSFHFAQHASFVALCPSYYVVFTRAPVQRGKKEKKRQQLCLCHTRSATLSKQLQAHFFFYNNASNLRSASLADL